jgi:hypothetical protein
VTASLPKPALYGLIGVVAFMGLFMFTRSRSGSKDASAPVPAEGAAAPSSGAGPAAAGGSASQPATAAPSAAGDAAQAPSAASESPAPAPTGGSATTVESSPNGLPAPVARALNAKKTVVLLFWNPAAVDDQSVKGSVDRLSARGGKVAVFSDGVESLSRYTQITAVANVTQTPSVVIVDRTGKAEVQAGYIDFQTLDQFVESALKR